MTVFRLIFLHSLIGLTTGHANAVHPAHISVVTMNVAVFCLVRCITVCQGKVVVGTRRAGTLARYALGAVT